MEGSPLLAYVDVATGEPYVLQWSGNAWTEVGPSMSSTVRGSHSLAKTVGNTGISVQAGPQGQILVAYVAADVSTGTDEVIARLWNPSTGWTDTANNAVVLIDEGLEVAYYADFDGWDFDNWGEAIDGDYAGADPGPYTRLYDEPGVWNSWGGETYTVPNTDPPIVIFKDPLLTNAVDEAALAVLVAESYDVEIGDFTIPFPVGVDPDLNGVDAGLLYTITVPTSADPPLGSVMETELDYQLELGNPGDATIEMDYNFDTQLAPNIDIGLYLTINGVVQAPAIGTEAAGGVGPAGYAHASFNTGDYVGPLSAGDRIGFLARGIMVAGAGGAVQDYNFNATDEGWLTSSSGGDPIPATQGGLTYHANPVGNGTRGLRMMLGDEDDLTTAGLVTITATAPMTTTGPGEVVVSFNYQMDTTANVHDNDRLSLAVVIDGVTEEVAFVDGKSANATALATVTFTGVAPGQHDVQIVGTLSNLAPDAGSATIGLDNISIDSGIEEQIVRAMIDNVGIFQNITASGTGTGEWEFSGRDPALGGNETGNNPLGRDGQESAVIHSHLGAVGQQIYTIDGIQQNDDGRMIVSFRYRYAGGAAGDNFNVILKNTSTPATYNVGTIGTAVDGTDTGWTWARVIASDLPPASPNAWEVTTVQQDMVLGNYQVQFVLANQSGVDADLWLDNVVVLTSQPTNAINPQAMLLPTGGGAGNQRNFAVGLTSESLGLQAYADELVDPEGATYPYPDGTFLSTAEGFASGYYAGQIAEFDTTLGWQLYGNAIDKAAPIDFLGFSNGQYLPEPSETWAHANGEFQLGINTPQSNAYRFDMAGDALYQLSDAAVGPHAVMWSLLQSVPSTWVDTNDDDINDQFNVVFDDVRLEVWRWDPWNGEVWVDMNLAPQTYSIHTNGQMVSSGGQDLTVAWTGRSATGGYWEAAAQRYFQNTNQWGVLNTENVNNDVYSGAMWLTDMIVRANGYPIVAGEIGHLWTDGIREFRPTSEIPVANITENSGSSGDNLLYFESSTPEYIDQAFSIRNSDAGDLVLYDLAFGTGELAENPFSFRNVPALPLRLDPGQSINIIVRFDPTGLPPEEYASVILLHTSTTDNPGNSVERFDTLGLFASVLRGAEVEISPVFLAYQAVTATGKPIEDLTPTEKNALQAQEVVIANVGNDDGDLTDTLTLADWFFTGNKFFVNDSTASAQWTRTAPDADAFLTQVNPATGGLEYRAVAVTDGSLTAPLAIEEGQFLTIQIVFAPDIIGAFTETFFVQTHDSDEPFVTVALIGTGISGANLRVTDENGVILRDGLDSIEFGSVLVGGDSGVLRLLLENTGTSDLTITNVATLGVLPAVTIDPVIDEVILEPDGPNSTMWVTINYDPIAAAEFDAAVIISNDSPALQERQYHIGMYGLGVVPEIPILDYTELEAPTLATGWTYQDINDPQGDIHGSGQADGGIDGAGDDVLLLTIPANPAGQANDADLAGRFTYSFTTLVRGPLTMSLSYRLETDADVKADETVELQWQLDGADFTKEGLYQITAPGAAAGDSGWQQVTLVRSDLAAGTHTLGLVGLLSSTAALGAGTATVKIDDVVLESPIEAIDFGIISAGDSTPRTINVNNIGGGNTILESFRFQQATAAFTIDPTNPEGSQGDINLAALTGSATATLEFLPPVGGFFSDTLASYYYDEVDDITYEALPLIGIATSSLMMVSDSQEPINDGLIDFGELLLGQSSRQEIITLANLGTEALQITSVEITDAAGVFTMIGAGEGPLTIQPGASRDVHVSFAPDAPGEFDATVTVTPSIGVSVNVSLAGAALPIPNQDVIIIPGQSGGIIQFNADDGLPILAGVGQTVQRSFLVTNTNNRDLLIRAINVDSNYFQMQQLSLADNSDDIRILPTGQYEVFVTFVAPPDTFFDGAATVTVKTTTDSDLTDDITTTLGLAATSVPAARIGDGYDKKTLWADSNGNPISLSLSGGGTATIIAEGGDDQSLDIARIVLEGTTSRSALRISGPDGAQIGGIIGLDEFMGQIVLKDVSLGAEGLQVGGLSKMLQIADITDGGDISIGDVLGRGLKIRLGQLGTGSDIDVSGNVTQFAATDFAGGSLNLHGGNLKKMTVSGNSFGGTVDVDGWIRSIIAKKATFTGSIEADEIIKEPKFASGWTGM